jgi:hypothetical protein
MYSYNLIVFKMRGKEQNKTKELFKINNLYFFQVPRFVDIPRPSYFQFIQQKDTMNLALIYGNTGNLLF